jgi:hypothetical protein
MEISDPQGLSLAGQTYILGDNVYFGGAIQDLQGPLRLPFVYADVRRMQGKIRAYSPTTQTIHRRIEIA